MYKIEHNYQHELPIINGNKFDLDTLSDLDEITPLEFGELITRTTDANAETPVQYTKKLSWFTVETENRKVKTQISKEYEHQYSGKCWIWGDGFILFSLCSYYGTGLKFFKGNICDHDFAEFNISRCYTRTECKKCNYTYTTDSSD